MGISLPRALNTSDDGECHDISSALDLARSASDPREQVIEELCSALY